MKLIRKVDTRCKWTGPLAPAMMAVLCLVFMVSTPAGAVNSFDPFPMGWYDVFAGVTRPALMATDTDVPGGQGSNIAIAYWMPYPYSGRMAYLDTAYSVGVGIILEVERDLVLNQDPAGISTFVAQWDDHPAVVGWYLFDEPYSNWGEVGTELQIAADAIRAQSSKPIVLLFGEPGIDAGKPAAWSSVYDIFGVDGYSCRMGEVEFSGLGSESPSEFPYWDDWKGLMDRTQAQSLAVGKPYWSVLSGFSDLVGETLNYRFPTNAESKFHTFYSLLRDASGLIYFSYYRAVDSPARPEEAYPFWGWTWLDTVMASRNDEVNLLGPALREGPIAGNAFSADEAAIIGDVYQDPGTSIFYVVALNKMKGDRAPSTITLNLQGLPLETPVAVRPLFEGSVAPIPLTAGGTQFSDDFSSYEVHLYQVIYEPADCDEAIADGYRLVGDFNDDCVIDMLDVASFVSVWLDCIEPGVSGCQTPWLP